MYKYDKPDFVIGIMRCIYIIENQLPANHVTAQLYVHTMSLICDYVAILIKATTERYCDKICKGNCIERKFSSNTGKKTSSK